MCVNVRQHVTSTRNHNWLIAAAFDAALVDLSFRPDERFGIFIAGLDEGVA